jgi:hypothetical protein
MGVSRLRRQYCGMSARALPVVSALHKRTSRAAGSVCGGCPLYAKQRPGSRPFASSAIVSLRLRRSDVIQRVLGKELVADQILKKLTARPLRCEQSFAVNQSSYRQTLT